MKRLLRSWVILGAVVALGSVSGCAVPEQEQANQQSGQEQRVQGNAADLALVTINLEAVFFTEMVEGAEQAAEKANASLTVFNANDDPAAQTNAIQNYIEQDVDGIMVVAIDTEGIQPAIKEAERAGIPVTAIDATVGSSAVDTQVGVDNAEVGARMGKFFNEWASKQDIDSAKIGIVSALNSTIQIQREDSFERTVKGAGHQIVQVVDGQNQQEQAQQAAEDLFTANPDMDAVYSTGEPALIGAVAAARSQGTESVTQFGWDLSEQAIQGIDDGLVEGVVQQDARTEGQRAVKATMGHIQEEKVPEDIGIPITIVTQKNVDQFRELFE